MNELEALLILNAIPGLENRKIHTMIESVGSAQDVLNLDIHQLKNLGILTEHMAQNIVYFSKDKFLQNEYNLIQKNKVKVLSYKDSQYPDILRQIPDAPIILYTRGNIEFLQGPSIAIVGSRRATLQGQVVAERFAVELSEREITIVSGMARGIDGAAHRGCLKAQGKTVAVLGAGLCHIYPRQHERLFDEIAQKGLLVSEYAMETPPVSYNFPRRNRIISGLSSGLLVVEAALKSGALITVDCALEQGKEVFAVPGFIDNPMTEGSNSLIKNGAKVVTTVDDILEEMHFVLLNQIPKHLDKIQDNPRDLTIPEDSVFQSIQEDPVHIDALIEGKKLTRSELISSLLHLELKQLIEQLPGQFFVRKHNKKGQHVKA